MRNFKLSVSAENGSVRTGAWFTPKDVYEVIDRYLDDGYSLEDLEFELSK